MRRFVRFLTYNNAVPIAVSFLLLGAASTYAATNPEVVLDKQQEVISIDNTYIANVNFKKYSPSIKILSVTEDDEKYFISYEFSTISLVDYVWQDVSTTEVMEISKQALGGHRDLGLYVTQELKEKLDGEIKRLKETQAFEKKKISNKKIATKYKGIVGGFLSDDVSTLDKYKPVVKQPKPEKEVQTFARPDPNAKAKPVLKPVVRPEEPEEVHVIEEPEEDEDTVEVDATGVIAGAATSSDETEEDTSGGGGSNGNNDEEDEIVNDAPTLTILGDNPARIVVGETYTDLGAAVTDDHDTALTIEVYVDGEPVEQVILDTSTTTTYSIVYESFDSAGKLAQEERIVEVYAPAAEDSGNSDGSDDGDDTEIDDTEVSATTTSETASEESVSEGEESTTTDEVEVTNSEVASETEDTGSEGEEETVVEEPDSDSAADTSEGDQDTTTPATTEATVAS